MATYCQPGKIGDVCNVLPIAYHEFEATGKKPVFVIAKKYASILDGCSYVIPAVFDGDWQDLKGAIQFARRNFSNVIVTSTFGKDFNIQQSESSFQLDQWKRAGCKEHFDKWPIIFDQRSTLRERILYQTIIPRENPKERGSPRVKFILLADESESSPFPKKDELTAMISKEFESTHKIIRLSDVKADFIFDLLALYDKADALVTIETVHLHLAKASKVPTFALTRDGWRGSLCSSRYRFCLKYSQWEANKLKFLFELQ